MVWMVVGGPLAVVVASLFTAFLAVKNVDPVLDISKIDPKTGHAPAMVGRNHSAEVATRPADQ
ncbi:MAG: hypothetical protein KGL90_09420 [Burkholderiales bacterium]|nr:hypothetical protein [Burkholderiales bacterium]